MCRCTMLSLRLTTRSLISNNNNLFKVKKFSNGNTENNGRNIIAVGTSIIGDIVSDGDFRIEGLVKGTIKAQGRIVVGKSGSVEGDITCQNADICGKVTGKLDVSNLTELKATAIVSGDVITKKISVEPDAVFSGTCKMESNKPTAKK